jgi:hypothetical protein
MKLFALPDKYRRGHFDRVRMYEKDIADLLERFRLDANPLLDLLSQHMLPSDVEELRKIVGEIEQRIARQSERFGESSG